MTLWAKLLDLVFWVLPWLLLALPGNRTRRALWGLLPYYVWVGIAFAMDQAMGFPPGLLIPLLATLCSLLLMGMLVRRWNGWAVLAATIGWAAAWNGIGAWVIPSPYAEMVLIGSFLLTGVASLALILTRLALRGRYRGGRLALFLLPATLLSALLALFFMEFDGGGAPVIPHLLDVLIPSLILGGVMYGLLMSFLAVPMASAFHRERLCALLKLKPAVPPPMPPPAG